MQTIPVSMRLNPSAAAYVIQGVVSEANNINAAMLAPQIQNAVRALYTMGGMIAVQAGSVLEQRLIAAAQQAQQAQTATVQTTPVASPVAPYTPPAAPVAMPVPPPPMAPLQQAAVMTGNPEIAVAGQPVTDITPLG